MMRSLAGRLDLCSINTATLGHREPIGRIVDAVAAAGFGGIAPWRRDLAGNGAGRVARRIADAGLRVSGLCRSTFMPAAGRAEFARRLDDNRRALDEAALLGADAFVIVAGSLVPGSRDLAGARGQVAEATACLLDHARASDVRLALEPLHPMYAADRSCLNTLAQALDLAETLEPEAASPRLGVAVDAYHVWWDPDLPPSLARAGASGRLFAFHVCDWLVPTRDFLTDRGMMGDGVIDLAALRRMTEEAGYDGLVEVEIFSALDWWRRPAEETLRVAAERLQSVC